jgi:hypothetical protein
LFEASERPSTIAELSNDLLEARFTRMLFEFRSWPAGALNGHTYRRNESLSNRRDGDIRHSLLTCADEIIALFALRA